jgi:hypothetical protein
MALSLEQHPESNQFPFDVEIDEPLLEGSNKLSAFECEALQAYILDTIVGLRSKTHTGVITESIIKHSI